MRTKVIENLCAGCGMCAQVCPEVYEMRRGKAIVIVASVPDNFVGNVLEIAAQCPAGAIEVERQAQCLSDKLIE